MNQAGALVMVYSDGSILLNHGGIEMGQGLYIKIAQVVAEVFQVDLGQSADEDATEKVPNTSPTAASSGADLNGMAAKLAAETIRDAWPRWRPSVSASPPMRWFENGAARSGNHRLDFAELAALCHAQRVPLAASGFYKTPKIHFDMKTLTGQPFYYFAHGVAASEVAVDTLTGEWKTLRVDILHDVGRSLNPAIDRGQIEGAFLQGLGWLTLEELVWDRGRTVAHPCSVDLQDSDRPRPAEGLPGRAAGRRRHTVNMLAS